MIATAGQIAEIYGIDRRTVTNWLNADPPCPSWKDGNERKFDTVRVDEWRVGREIQRALIAAGPAPLGEKEAEETRKIRIQADREALKLEKELGEAVDLDYMERHLAAAFGEVASRLKNLPSMAPRLAGIDDVSKVERLIEDEVNAMLSMLASAGERLPADDEDEDDDASNGETELAA